MTVTTNEYNFYQKKASWGDVLGNGILGGVLQAAGLGGGCCSPFGGMGMGIGMGMGMGGSIFSGAGMFGLGSFGGCYSQSTSDIMGEAAFAGMNVIGTSIANSIANKHNSKNTTSNELKTINEKIDTQLKILGDDFNIGNYNTATVEDKYTTRTSTALSNINNEINHLKDELNKLGEKSDITVNQEPANNYASRLADAQAEWDKQNGELTAKIKKLNDKKDTSNPLVKEYLEAKKAEETRQKEIQSAIEALNKLKPEYEKLNAQNDAETLQKKLNEADRSAATRTVENLRNTDKGKATTALHNFRKAQKKWMNGDHSDVTKNELQDAHTKLNDNIAWIKNDGKSNGILKSINKWVAAENLGFTLFKID